MTEGTICADLSHISLSVTKQAFGDIAITLSAPCCCRKHNGVVVVSWPYQLPPSLQVMNLLSCALEPRGRGPISGAPSMTTSTLPPKRRRFSLKSWVGRKLLRLAVNSTASLLSRKTER